MQLEIQELYFCPCLACIWTRSRELKKVLQTQESGIGLRDQKNLRILFNYDHPLIIGRVYRYHINNYIELQATTILCIKSETSETHGYFIIIEFDNIGSTWMRNLIDCTDQPIDITLYMPEKEIKEFNMALNLPIDFKIYGFDFVSRRDGSDGVQKVDTIDKEIEEKIIQLEIVKGYFRKDQISKLEHEIIALATQRKAITSHARQ